VTLEILQKFVRDIKKYREYITTAVSTEFSLEFSKSHIGYLWWILDPLLYMLIYIFVVSIVLKRGGPAYPVFLFTGLLFWRWTSDTMNRSTFSITSKKSILSQVYIPKPILPLIKILVNTTYFLFSILVLLLVLWFYKIPLTPHILEFIPIFVVQWLFIFGLSLWLTHLGVYYYDIDRVLSLVLRLWYYISPGLYDLSAVPDRLQFILWLNPLTTTFVSSRNVFMYGEHPVYAGLLAWGGISLGIVYFGLKQLYKFDRIYTKVI
jgi:ABC-type polysaccharide/polyol phosphate export permease